MKNLMIAALMLTAGVCSAQTHVDGYTKKDGTYVAPHVRTAPDATKDNNYSTKGNTNPYTGKEGTVTPQPTNPYATPPAPAPAPQTDVWGNTKRK